jgi:hypothetical protein
VSHPILVTPRNGPVMVGLGARTSVNVDVGTTGKKGDQGDPGPQGPPGEVNVVEMTMEEFQALPVKDPDTIYVITVDPVQMTFLSSIQNRLTALEEGNA